MRLRLLLTEKCNRKCHGCCNKDFDLSALEVCKDYSGYECIMLTGGEPMLDPQLVKEAAKTIKQQTNAPIYLYTAKTDNALALSTSLWLHLDGVTVTLHNKKDIEPFLNFDKEKFLNKSLRLNIFKGVTLRDNLNNDWKIKRNIRWIKNCPLPEDEVFMKYGAIV